jgi:protein-disulfide isomerase
LAGIILAITTYMVRQAHILPSSGPIKTDLSIMTPISVKDHIIGAPTAPVVFVEYGDIDSQYSKDFQKAMQQLMTEYGANGKVAWVYRHFPLISEHQYAETHAEAAECAASVGGANAFWRFIDIAQAYAPDTHQFNPADYSKVVPAIGISLPDFVECMQKHTFTSAVKEEFDNALAMGASGSPYTVLMVKGQPPVAISGALPYTELKKLVDQSIAKAAK